jgi:hypothetical protein
MAGNISEIIVCMNCKKESKIHIILIILKYFKYEGASRIFQNGCLERELQMVQPSATRCSCIAIL